MDMCSIDWELSSKFIPIITGIIPIGITWFLYKQWYLQKGKEVIANESKELFKMLEEINHCLEGYHLDMISNYNTKSFRPYYYDKDKVMYFRNMTMEFISRYNFILFNNKNEDTKLLYNKYLNLNGTVLEIFISQHYDLNDFSDVYYKYLELTSLIKNDLYKYCIYKKFV